MGNDCTNPENWCFYFRQCHLYGSLDSDRGYYLSYEESDADYSWCRNVVYCEDLLFIPEYASAITAIFISLMALWQLSWDHPIAIMRFLSAMFFANGVTSCINHWTGSGIFSFLDNATMYIPLFVMIGISANKFIGRTDGTPEKISQYYYCRYFGRVCMWLVVTFILALLLFNDWTYSPNEGVFVSLFGLPLLALVGIGIYVVKKHSMKRFIAFTYYKDENAKLPKQIEIANKNAEVFFERGLIVSGVCGAIWLISEPICTNTDATWMKYLFGHSLWHIGMSYGLSLVLIYFTYLECILRGHMVYFAGAKDVFLTNILIKYKCNCQKLAFASIGEIKEHAKDQRLWMPVLFVLAPTSEVSDEIAHLTGFIQTDRDGKKYSNAQSVSDVENQAVEMVGNTGTKDEEN